MSLDVSVRFIPVEYCTMKDRTVVSRTKPALCFRGDKKAYGIYNDDLLIDTVELPVEEVDISRPVPYGGDEYPIPLYIQHLQNNPKPHSPQADWLLEMLKELPNDFPDEAPKPQPKVQAKASPKSSIIAILCDEFKTTGSKIRKFLRSKGFSAPYTDEKAIRKVMKEFK